MSFYEKLVHRLNREGCDHENQTTLGTSAVCLICGAIQLSPPDGNWRNCILGTIVMGPEPELLLNPPPKPITGTEQQ